MIISIWVWVHINFTAVLLKLVIQFDEKSKTSFTLPTVHWIHHCAFRIYSSQKPLSQTQFRMQFQNFKHAILWSTPSTPFFKARPVRFLLKHAKHPILWSTSSTPFCEVGQARKHAKFIKHSSMPSTRAHKAHQVHEYAKQVK